MEDDLITTKEVGDYRIKVYYCRDSECPITNWGLFGSFFFEYSDIIFFSSSDTLNEIVAIKITPNFCITIYYIVIQKLIIVNYLYYLSKSLSFLLLYLVIVT